MIVLGIDTSGILGGVALARGERLLAEARVDARAAASERIVPQIDRLLADLGLGREALERVGVVTGPGSFTGLRVGLATAKGLAVGLGCATLGISAIEARAAAVGAGEHPVLVLTSARRGEVFCGAGWHGAGDFHWLLPQASRSLPGAAEWVGAAVRAAERLGRLPLLCAGDGAELLDGSDAVRAAGSSLLLLPGAATAAVPGAAALLAARADPARLKEGAGLDELALVYLRGAEARRPLSG
jgi:tRNA threonylcarbamoyladenosine biosynthesis protein TsaB